MTTGDEQLSHGQILAGHLRRLRTQRGLSLNQLAREAGISKATLSGLEAGRGNPTMVTLINLALALEASPSDLLARPANNQIHVVHGKETTEILWPVVTLQFLDRIVGGSEVVELYHMHVPVTDKPQTSAGHPGVEHVVVNQGSLRIGPEGHVVDVGPGDYVTFDGAKPHSYFAADGPVSATLLLAHRRGQDPVPQPGSKGHTGPRAGAAPEVAASEQHP